MCEHIAKHIKITCKSYYFTTAQENNEQLRNYFFTFLRIKKKTKKTILIESVRGMLYKIYHPFVYGIHVTRSWLRLTLCLDRISSNFQYSMTARSKELIIKIHGDNSKVFHCEVKHQKCDCCQISPSKHSLFLLSIF